MPSTNEYAFLRLRVADEVPVFPLSVFLSYFRDVYGSHIFLDKVEHEGIVPPSDYLPPPDQDLYINRMEVGTPNFLELFGLSGPLLDTFGWVAMLAAGLKTVDFAVGRTLTHVKTGYDIAKLRKELKKPEAVQQRAQSEGQLTAHPLPPPDPEQMLDRRAARLSSRLPDGEAAAKIAYMRHANEWMVRYALSKGIVYAPEIIVIQTPERQGS